MEVAVYVAVPSGDDSDLIARGARAAAPQELRFSIRGKSDPSASSDGELCFRVKNVEHPDEAMSRALEIYGLGRHEAGLQADDRARASLTAWAPPGSEAPE